MDTNVDSCWFGVANPENAQGRNRDVQEVSRHHGIPQEDEGGWLSWEWIGPSSASEETDLRNEVMGMLSVVLSTNNAMDEVCDDLHSGRRWHLLAHEAFYSPLLMHTDLLRLSYATNASCSLSGRWHAWQSGPGPVRPNDDGGTLSDRP